MASIKPNPQTPPPPTSPTEIYHAHFPSTSPIKLRIAAGGAGQAGILRALGDAFIGYRAQKSPEEPPFAIAWFASDTSISFNNLALDVVDVSFTYHEAAETTAVRQGVAERREFAWRDHWMVVGPSSNPAGLKADKTTTVHDLFTRLFIAIINSSSSPTPIRFLSRYDKSANNIKESSLWAAIGQTPWSHPYSSWYHRYVDFPFQALEAAALLGEYTLTDRGTWFSVQPWVRERLGVFMASSDDLDDPLLNPAHVLVGTRSPNKAVANEFVDWLIAPEGQKVIEEFENNGVRLYTGAPTRRAVKL